MDTPRALLLLNGTVECVLVTFKATKTYMFFLLIMGESMLAVCKLVESIESCFGRL